MGIQYEEHLHTRETGVHTQTNAQYQQVCNNLRWRVFFNPQEAGDSKEMLRFRSLRPGPVIDHLNDLQQ